MRSERIFIYKNFVLDASVKRNIWIHGPNSCDNLVSEKAINRFLVRKVQFISGANWNIPT